MTGSPSEVSIFTSFLDTFVHGPIEYVTEKEPRVYCGVAILKHGFSYGLPQDGFMNNAHILRESDFLLGSPAKF